MEIRGKIIGKVVYDDQVNTKVYTLKLDTGNYIPLNLDDTRKDKLEFNIGDNVKLNLIGDI